MGNTRLLADNLLSPSQYDVTLTPNEETEGTGTGQAFRLSDGRRYTMWTPTTTNQEATVKWQHSPLLPHPFDMVVIDRGSILTRLIVETSGDNFTTDSDVFDITLPTTPGTGMLTDALGVRTFEGAWMKRFDVVGNAYGRLRIPAMGSGLKPQIIGAWVGLSWSPDFVLRPWAPKRNTQRTGWGETSLGGVGRTRVVPRREGVIEMQMPDVFLSEQGSYHLQLIDHGCPFWIVPDDERADESFLAIRRPDLAGLGLEPNWFYERGMVPYVEYFPLIRERANA